MSINLSYQELFTGQLIRRSFVVNIIYFLNKDLLFNVGIDSCLQLYYAVILFEIYLTNADNGVFCERLRYVCYVFIVTKPHYFFFNF